MRSSVDDWGWYRYAWWWVKLCVLYCCPKWPRELRNWWRYRRADSVYPLRLTFPPGPLTMRKLRRMLGLPHNPD